MGFQSARVNCVVVFIGDLRRFRSSAKHNRHRLPKVCESGAQLCSYLFCWLILGQGWCNRKSFGQNAAIRSWHCLFQVLLSNNWPLQITQGQSAYILINVALLDLTWSGRWAPWFGLWFVSNAGIDSVQIASRSTDPQLSGVDINKINTQKRGNSGVKDWTPKQVFQYPDHEREISVLFQYPQKQQWILSDTNTWLLQQGFYFEWLKCDRPT